MEQWAGKAVGIRDATRRYKEVDVDGWWWLPIGLVAWFAVAMAVALWLGPVLRGCAQAREAGD